MLIGAWAASPAEAAVSQKDLSVIAHKQEQSNWCWAASARMIAVWHQTIGAFPQCTIVGYTLGGSGCPNSTATDDQVRAALGVAGKLSGTLVYGGPTIGTIKAQIDASQPMEFDYAWTKGGKHVVVVTGYYYDTAPTATDPSYVYWKDPADGLSKGSSLAKFLSNGDWKASFYITNIKR